MGVMFALILPAVLSLAGGGVPPARIFPLATTTGLEMSGTAVISASTYRGKKAVALTEALDPNFGDLAIVKGSDFHNGTIEFDLAGLLTDGAPLGARSFCGIAFHISDDARKFENFYLRMTNGRANDQEQRNHSAQYCSIPNYTWDVLRKKAPFRYEAYTDLTLGAWTHVKIWVQGTEAKLFVNNATQPTLIVHGLFMGDTHGKIALWVAGYTKAYFANLTMKPS